MAHQITNTDTIVYTGEKPWHGLGIEVPEDTAVGVWADMAFPWEAKRAYVRYAIDREGTLRTDEDNIVLFRSDNGDRLGVVSSKFEVHQPKEIVQSLDELVRYAGFKIITAGSLFGGRKVWVQADIGERSTVIGGDMVEGKLLIATAMDGSMATTWKNCNTRVVCNNTITAALGERGKSFMLSHRQEFDADKVKDELGLAVTQYQKFITDMRELAHYGMSPAHAEAMTIKLLTGETDVESEKFAKAREHYGFKKIMGLFNGDQMGYGLPGTVNTAWGWVNAVTEFSDHHARTRGADSKLDSIWFGKLDATKRTAANDALALLAA